jgi:hypothetical protein
MTDISPELARMVEQDIGRQWIDVPGYEGLYRVSDHGEVEVYERTTEVVGRGGTKYLRFRPAARLKPWITPDGYSKHGLCKAGVTKSFHAHQLIMLAFVGERPRKRLVRHIDGNPRNNQLSNLCYGTYQENAQDAISHGTIAWGERSNLSKFSEEKIEVIRKLCKWFNTDEIAKFFNMSKTHVRDIKNRKYWKYLK